MYCLVSSFLQAMLFWLINFVISMKTTQSECIWNQTDFKFSTEMEEWDRIIKSVARIVNHGYLLGFHATKWNLKSGFTFKSSKVRKWFQTILAVLRNGYLIFLAIRHFQLSKHTELPFHKRGQIMYFFFVYVCDNIIAIYGTMFNYESLHHIIQSNLDMAMNFERKFLENFLT